HAAAGVRAARARAAPPRTAFLPQSPDCSPPVVINITDGKPTDRNPLADAERVRALASSDGNVLLFNLHISGSPLGAVAFPDSEALLTDQYARLLFRMSSVLPQPL